MKKIIVTLAIVLAGLCLVAAECAGGETTPTNRPTTAEPTWTGPVPPDQRPDRPAEGVETIQGCPVTGGIVVDIYHGTITKSQADNRVGAEATFVLRWVNDLDHQSGNGGCWQQTAFTDPAADQRLESCQIEGQREGSNWPSCMKDG